MNNLKLYELSNQYNQVAELLEDSDDKELLYDTLEALDDSFTDKAESIVKLMKSKQAEFDALAAEAKRLTDRAAKVAKSQEWLHDYLQRSMVAMGKQEVKSILFKIAFQSNPESVDVLNESEIPETYFVQPPLPDKKLDKRLLLADLKNGLEIAGADIKKTQRLVIK